MLCTIYSGRAAHPSNVEVWHQDTDPNKRGGGHQPGVQSGGHHDHEGSPEPAWILWGQPPDWGQ